MFQDVYAVVFDHGKDDDCQEGGTFNISNSSSLLHTFPVLPGPPGQPVGAGKQQPGIVNVRKMVQDEGAQVRSPVLQTVEEADQHHLPIRRTGMNKEIHFKSAAGSVQESSLIS